jgi:hypothetical protein
MFRRLVFTLCLLALAASSWPATAQTPFAAAPIAQRYDLDVAFDPGAASLTGTIAIAWTNTTGGPQDALPLRLYPNAEHYGEGGITLDAVQVDGVTATVDGDPDDLTVARVPFAEPVAPGASRSVEIAFTTTIPIDSDGSFGIFRGNSADGTWSLVNWYPIVAGWEPGTGWYLEPLSAGVDPTLVTASAWHGTITHPADYTLVVTGDETTTVDGDSAVTRIDLPIGRELAMVAVPTETVETTAGDAGDTPVVVTLPRAWAVPGMEETLLAFAGEAVPRLADWIDAPLAGELDITSAELDGALGVSWTGAIWLDLGQLAADGRLDEIEQESLRFYVYHEIAHQWFSNLVGANTNDHTWMAEGMAGVLAVAVIRDEDGGRAAQGAFAAGVVGPYRAFVNGGQDAVADAPMGTQSGVVHSIVSYGKGGIGFETIRQEIGDDAFFGALARLADADDWGIIMPDQMLAAFETSSGLDLYDLWTFWFEDTGATVEQVDAVIAGASG